MDCGDDDLKESSNTERSLLPPSDSYIAALDRLWFDSIRLKKSAAKLEDRWIDGVIYFTYCLPGNEVVSDTYPWSLHCVCQGVEILRKQYSVFTPICSVVVCCRNAILKELVSSSITAATEMFHAQNFACANSAECPSKILTISLNSVLSLEDKFEAMVLCTCVLRYIYSSTLSIDSLLMLANEVDNPDIAMSSSFDCSLEKWNCNVKAKSQEETPIHQLINALTVVNIAALWLSFKY